MVTRKNIRKGSVVTKSVPKQPLLFSCAQVSGERSRSPHAEVECTSGLARQGSLTQEPDSTLRVPLQIVEHDLESAECSANFFERELRKFSRKEGRREREHVRRTW
jgi:hypothetical protein